MRRGNTEQLWQTWRVTKERRHGVAYPVVELASSLPDQTRAKACLLADFAC